MKMVALQAAARSTDVSPKQLRRGGKVPCIVYGNIENTQLQCDENVLLKAFVQAGESSLVELDMDGKKVPVLFHHIEFDPVSDRLSHVDFFAVNMKKEVEAPVSIRFEGESPAAKEGAIIVTALDSVTVRCLPSNLPHDLPVSLSKLTEMGASITIADLEIPEGVAIIEAPETVLAIAQQPREEEKAEEVAAPSILDQPEPGAEGAPAEGAAAEEGKKEE